MKEIPVGNSRIAMVDDEDYPLLSRHHWVLHKPHSGKRHEYAAINYGRGGRSVFMAMHRMIMGVGSSLVDHIDGNGLNNQKSNLRVATSSQNNANRGMTKSSKTGFKGVKNGKKGKFLAQICVNKYQEHIGTFDNPRDAAMAYDKRAIQFFGGFAKTNAMMGLL